MDIYVNMKKIIKLKESDLKRLVQQVIEEQTSGDPKVSAIQSALIKAGYGKYLGTSGPNKNGVDGVYGNNTKEAVKQFQLRNKIQPVDGIVGPTTAPKLGVQPMVGKVQQPQKTQQPTQQTQQPQQSEGAFTKVVNFFKSAANKIGNAFSLPIHVRAFKDFATFRKKPFTISDMTQNEKVALSQMVDYAFKNKKFKGGMVNFYEIANALNKGGGDQINFKDKKTLGLNQSGVKSDYTKIALTIGNARVTKTGNGYKVSDLYDFNNYANNPEKYTWDQTPDTLKDSFAKIGSGNYVQGVEQLASYYQKWGYKGFSVDIDISTQQS